MGIHLRFSIYDKALPSSKAWLNFNITDGTVLANIVDGTVLVNIADGTVLVNIADGIVFSSSELSAMSDMGYPVSNKCQP